MVLLVQCIAGVSEVCDAGADLSECLRERNGTGRRRGLRGSNRLSPSTLWDAGLDETTHDCQQLPSLGTGLDGILSAWANRDLENMVWNMLDETYGDEIARSASIYVTLDGSGEAEVIHTDGSRKPEGTTKLKANGDVIKLKYIPEFNG